MDKLRKYLTFSMDQEYRIKETLKRGDYQRFFKRVRRSRDGIHSMRLVDPIGVMKVGLAWGKEYVNAKDRDRDYISIVKMFGHESPLTVLNGFEKKTGDGFLDTLRKLDFLSILAEMAD